MTDSLCNEQRSVYIWEEAGWGSFRSNKTSGEHPWRTDAPSSAPKQASSCAHITGRQLWSIVPCKERTPVERKEARLWILVFPHLWITWKLETVLTHATQGATWELPWSEKKDLYAFFCLFFCFVFPPLVYLFWSREVLLGWWRGCPGEATRMAAWFTFTIAFSTTLISQVWRRMRHLPLWSQRQHGELRLSV